MANTPATPDLPKHHASLSTSEEVAEKVLNQVEDENREFYETAVNLNPDDEVTLLQTGIKDSIARALLRGRPYLNIMTPGDAYARRVSEEKMDAALYRAVHGNEIYDTEHGEDSKQYTRSVNREYLDSDRSRRGRERFMRVARGVGSMLGTNNYVEAQVEDRFGHDRDPDARRRFVAGRLENPLTDLEVAAPDLFANLVAMLGLPVDSTLFDVQNSIAECVLTELRQIRQMMSGNPAGIIFNGTPAFNDLMMLVDIEQRTGAEFRVASVYNREPLRKFWNVLPQNVRDQVTSALEENELFPLESNLDSTALLAELRSRFYVNLRNGAENPGNALDELRNEIQNIQDNEFTHGEQTEQQQALTTTINEQITEMRSRQDSLAASFATLRQISANIATINTQIGNGNMPPAQITAAQGQITNLHTQQNQAIATHKTLEREYSNFARILVNNLNSINNHPAIPPLLTVSSALTPSSDAMLQTPPMPPAVNPFEVHILQDGNNIKNDLDQTIPNRFLSLLRGRSRMTSFTLLQRLMRRDYMNNQSPPLDPSLYNEEANHYANIKAALRVEDVKSADRKRTSNQQAAELLDRGLIGRGWDRLKYAVARGQDFVGLEPINFAEITADRMLEQLINSEDEFTVFRGIDKFTTVRDLRQVINQTGKTVPRETLERFSLVLEDAISRFKKVRPSLEKGLDPDDWDLENLITVFKKFKAEMWSMDFLEQVESTGEPGERELTLTRMLRGSRENERLVEKSISEDVKDPDAMWRVYLAKNELKKVLNSEQLEASNQIRARKIAEKRARITRVQSRLNSLPEGHSNRRRLQAEITNLENSVITTEQQTEMAQNLHDRVQEAREYIRENKLSRRQRREYLDSVGLTQVFDKMSTNFRLQHSWKFTKKAADATWKGTKGLWAWSRRKFLNRDTAGKTYEVGRLLATPGVALTKGVWKVGMFVPGLIGKAMGRATDMPKRLIGTMNHNTLRSYYRDRINELVIKIHKVQSKVRKQQKKLERVHYSYTKKRIAKKINKLEEEIYAYKRKVNSYHDSATKRKINLGDIAYYTEATADVGSVETYAVS